jgi:RNA polymerase sigma-70 factor (ECF subfamily)
VHPLYVSTSLEPNAGLLTDEEAMWQVQTLDDHGAFARLVQRWERPIKRLCAQVTGDAHLAEDLCQEAFARVFLKRKLYRPRSKFSTWLWRIALNLCYSKLRIAQSRLDRRVQPSEDTNADFAEASSALPSPDQRLLAQEQADLVQDALSRLPESLRVILVMRYCEGMKLRAAAKKLGVPESTAASRCAAALARLTRILENELVP